MRIPSGSIDRKIYFVAVDSTDLKTRETGLSSFTVYRSRDGGAATAYTTPTVAELSAANMPGVYCLTLDEDTTIAVGHDTEEYCVHITQASMAPVTRTVELYRPKATEGQTITAANGCADADIERVQGDAQSATDLKDFADAGYDPATNKVEGLKLADTLTTYTGDTPQTGDAYARLGAPAGASVSADIADVESKVDDLEGRLTSARALLLDQLDPAVGGTLANEVEAVKAKTDNLPSDPADQSLIIAATDAIMSRLGAPAGASVSADIADVEGKVDDLETRLSAARATLLDQLDPAVGGTLANEVEAIKAKTDNLPAEPADASDIAASFATVNTKLDTIDDFVDTEVGAIKAKTDNLPEDPADQSLVIAATTAIMDRLGAPAGASVSADLADVEGKVDDLEGRLTAARAALLDQLEPAIAGTVANEVEAIKAKTDNLPASPAATGDVPTAVQNADALLDRVDAIEAGLTPRGALRLCAAESAGDLSGAGTGTEIIRNAVADSKNRITAAVDEAGNRTITTDLT